MKKNQTIFLLLAISLNLLACKDDDASQTAPLNKATVVIAQAQPRVDHLYYTGTLMPLSSTPVVSEVEGVVTELHFSYGSSVLQNAQLLVIDSHKLSNDFRQAFTDYLQKKDAFENAKRIFAGSVELNKAGLIPANEFNNERSQMETANLNFHQAVFQLSTILHKANVPSQAFLNLSIADTTKVSELMKLHFSKVPVTSPKSGIALFPTGSGPSSGSGEGEVNRPLVIGSSVREGQELLNIGNLAGLSATLQVNEVDVDRIRPGMQARLSGDAFPGLELQGKVISVSSQAQSGTSGGLGMFEVIVQVPKLTPEQRKPIRIGMSAKVNIEIKSASAVVLPIAAVFHKNQQAMVTIINSENVPETVAVITGPTTLTGVTILKGVVSGQKVVVPQGPASAEPKS